MIARQVLQIPVYSGPEPYVAYMMLGSEQRLDLQQHQISVLQLFDTENGTAQPNDPKGSANLSQRAATVPPVSEVCAPGTGRRP